MKVHGLKTCDTCRKALKTLREAGVAPIFVDLRDTPLSNATLARFLDAFGESLVNRRSTTWRGLSEDDRARPPAELLAAHPTLMKRPVIEAGDGRLFLGWDKRVQAAVLDQA